MTNISESDWPPLPSDDNTDITTDITVDTITDMTDEWPPPTDITTDATGGWHMVAKLVVLIR